MTERALVTGGAGVIGSHLVDALVTSGYRVTVLDDLSTGKLENLTTRLSVVGGSVRFVRGDVLDAVLVEELVAEHDIVYHLAAAVGVKRILADPLRSIQTNVRGTEHVLAAAHRRQTRVVLASSSETYGKSPDSPFREDGDRVLGPTSVHRWSYATAKAIDEHLAFAYIARGLPVTILRYFNSYGPRIDESGYGTVIARFAAQALAGRDLTVHGDGLQTRCFTYIDDTVRGTILAAQSDQAVGLVLNIGSLEEVRIRDLASLVREILGSRSEIHHVPYESYYGLGFEDTRRRVPDVRRAREILGFTATVPFREGLERTLQWCRDHYTAATRAAP